MNIDLNRNDNAISGAGLFGALGIGFLILGAIAVFIATIVGLASWLRLDFDGTFWAGVGGILLVLTLLRPWWFWDHPKALIARKLLTDPGTILAYSAVAVFFIVTGVRRDMAIVHARSDCVQALARARDSHDRVRALYAQGVTDLPHLDREQRSFTCERLLESH